MSSKDEPVCKNGHAFKKDLVHSSLDLPRHKINFSHPSPSFKILKRATSTNFLVPVLMRSSIFQTTNDLPVVQQKIENKNLTKHRHDKRRSILSFGYLC